MRTITLTLLLAIETIRISGQNLIFNSSFESSGQINCQSWFDPCGRELTYLCDTITPDTLCGVQFDQDAPFGGGNWCVQTGTGMFPPQGIVQTFVTGLSVTGIFQLTYWMATFNGSWGYSEISQISQGQLVKTKSFSSSPANWNQYTFIDTLILLTTDTISIKFWAGASPFDAGGANIDLVELALMDTLFTSFCTDTITVFDTTFVTVNDTIQIYDTIFVTINDTVQIYDTTFLTVIDTVPVYDTVLVTVIDTLIIDVNTGLIPPNDVNTIKVFPNPAKTHITIDNGIYSLLNGYKVKIEDSIGQQVFFSLINQQQFYIDLSAWTGNGIYYLSIIDGQGNTFDLRKIVLQ